MNIPVQWGDSSDTSVRGWTKRNDKQVSSRMKWREKWVSKREWKQTKMGCMSSNASEGLVGGSPLLLSSFVLNLLFNLLAVVPVGPWCFLGHSW